MHELVSVIVPVYNVYKYLPNCVKSILKQTYKDIEIVLVDDESPDECGALCDEYAQRYENIKVVHRKNGGLGIARNTGIENATGNYIAFVDGDDFIGRDHIENLMTCLRKTQSDACYGGYRQQAGEKYTIKENPLKNAVYERTDVIKEFLPHLFGKLDYHTTDDVQMSVCMGIYSRNIMEKHNIRFHSERELISEDLIFNVDFLEHVTKVCTTDSCEYYYRYTEGSLSKSFREDRLDKQTVFTEYVINLTKNIGIFDLCEQRIYSTYLAWVRAIIQGEQQKYRNVGLKKSISNIKNICNNPFVVEICSKYDESNLTPKLKLMHRLIKEKLYYLLWLISYVKSKI